MFLFLRFLLFHSCSSFFPVPLFHLFYYLLFLFSLSLGDDTKWPTRVDMSLNPNTKDNWHVFLLGQWAYDIIRSVVYSVKYTEHVEFTGCYVVKRDPNQFLHLSCKGCMAAAWTPCSSLVFCEMYDNHSSSYSTDFPCFKRMVTRKICNFLWQPCSSFADLHGSCTAILWQPCKCVSFFSYVQAVNTVQLMRQAYTAALQCLWTMWTCLDILRICLWSVCGTPRLRNCTAKKIGLSRFA